MLVLCFKTRRELEKMAKWLRGLAAFTEDLVRFGSHHSHSSSQLPKTLVLGLQYRLLASVGSYMHMYANVHSGTYTCT